MKIKGGVSDLYHIISHLMYFTLKLSDINTLFAILHVLSISFFLLKKTLTHLFVSSSAMLQKILLFYQCPAIYKSCQ